MQAKLLLDKMEVKNGIPIQYFLLLPGSSLPLNEFLGKIINIEFTGNLYCIKCGRKSSKLFGQGFCFPCFQTAPEAEECVLHPEMCRAHEGIARDMDFAKQHCLIDHFVYLASSEHVKVGVTRYTQIPTRWIDQGASSATIIAKTPNRYTAGLIEVSLKKILPDKTNWRSMLTNRVMESVNYAETIAEIQKILPDYLKQYLVPEQPVEILNYPVLEYPQKVNSIDLLKQPQLSGKLIGIKGQYLLFENGNVINIRKHTGFEIQLEVND